MSGPASRRRRAAFFALAVTLPACGYSLAHKGQGPLRVAAFRNDTAEAEAGGIFAAELRGELHARGRLAEEAAVAPAIEGEIVALRSSTSSTGGDGAQAFRLDALVKLHGAGYEDTLSGGEDFLAGVDVLGTEANRRAALRRLARQLSRELVERLEVAGRLK